MYSPHPQGWHRHTPETAVPEDRYIPLRAEIYEKGRIKLIHPFQKSTPLAISLASLWVFVIIQAVIPTGRGDFCNAILAFLQILPEFFNMAGLRVTSREHDDGDVQGGMGLP